MVSKCLETQQFDVRFKILLLGESTVGKSSIMRCLTGQTFNPGLVGTIGVDFEKKIYMVQGKAVMLEIWDTAGQERFYAMTNHAYRDTKGFLFIYDVTNPRSLERIRSFWLKSVDEHFEEPVPIFLVGNKIDLQDKRLVTTEDGEKLHKQQCTHGFFETSAKNNTNISDLFTHVAEMMATVWGLPENPHEELCLTRQLSEWRPKEEQTCKKKSKKKKKGRSILAPRNSIKLEERKNENRNNCSCGSKK